MKDGKPSGNSPPSENGRVTWRVTAAGTGFPPPAELRRERPEPRPVPGTFRICGVAAVEGSAVLPS